MARRHLELIFFSFLFLGAAGVLCGVAGVCPYAAADKPPPLVTPKLFRVRRIRRLPCEEASAWALWTRTHVHRERLTEPDAWFHLTTGELRFEPCDGFQALRPGDVIKTTNIAYMPYITHDCLYIGKGFVVSFLRPGDCSLTEGVIRVDRLDGDGLAKRTWLPVTTPTGLPCHVRYGRIRRALASVGFARYHPIHFNCQHAVGAWITPRASRFETSIGTRRVATFAVGTLALLGSAISVLCVGATSSRHNRARRR